MCVIGIIIRLNSFLFEEAFENLRQKVPLGPADIRVFSIKFQNGKELLWAERKRGNLQRTLQTPLTLWIYVSRGIEW